MPDDSWRAGVRRTSAHHDPYAIPAGLPYTACGYHGDYVFYINGMGAFLAFRIGDVSRESVPFSVFADAEDPQAIYRCYPRIAKNKETGAWEPIAGTYRRSTAAKHMLDLAYRAGVFLPHKQVRGRGASIDLDRKGPRLALNRGLGIGKGMHLGHQAARHGLYNGFAYVAGSPVLTLGRRPDDLERAVAGLDTVLASWTWTYPRLGPRLLAGWLALGPLSGALPVHPTLALAGDRGATGRLLRYCEASLGPWATVVADATPAALDDADDYDTLPLIVTGVPGEAPVRPIVRRRPLWVANVGPRATARLRLVRAEAATVLGLGAEDGLIELGVGGHALGDPEAFGAWITSDLHARWRRVTEELYPAWCRLLDVQEGATRESRLLALLLAGATALRGEADPTEADFFALEAELSACMLTQRSERLPAPDHMLELYMGLVIDPWSVTVVQETGAAAGYGAGDGAHEAANAIEERTYLRTEPEAIAHALHDPLARRAAERVGQLGFRVLGDMPGERRLAIAYTAPARTRMLERMGVQDYIAAQGWTVANTLLQVKGAHRVRGNVWFPGGRGSCRCIAIPLGLVLDRLVGPDPAGVADAQERMEGTE